MLSLTINLVRRHWALSIGLVKVQADSCISPSPQCQVLHDLPRAPCQLLDHLHMLEVSLKEILHFFREQPGNNIPLMSLSERGEKAFKAF